MSNKTRLQQNNSELNEIYSIASSLIKQQDVLTTLTSDADATAENILAPYTAYVKGEKITGTGVKGGCKIYNGTIKPASDIGTIKINNPFGNVGKVKYLNICYVISSHIISGNSIILRIDANLETGKAMIIRNDAYVERPSTNSVISITDQDITFKSYGYLGQFKSSQDYYWEVIGNE